MVGPMPRAPQTAAPLRRVAVLGMAGAGKSTLAAKLGEALDARVFHLDAVYWKLGWVAAEREDFRVRHAALLELERWVLDGNYAWGGRPERLARADAVVVLTVARRTALWRVVRRSLRHHGTTRADLGEGRPERVSPSFLRWVWNWPRTHPDFVEHIRREAAGTPVVVLRTAADAERFVEEARRRA
jgi:adenylate kinase family enzyme